MRYNGDLEYFGKRILRNIQDAVETGDFSCLSQNVREAVDSALGGRNRYQGQVDIDLGTRGDPDFGTRQGPGWEASYGRTAGPSSAGSSAAGSSSAGPSAAGRPGRYSYETSGTGRLRYTNTGGKKAVGLLLAVIGYFFSGLWLLTLLFAILGGVLLEEDLLAGIAGLVVLLVPSCLLAAAGTRRLGRVKRFRIYIETIKNEEYCNVKDLAKRIVKPESYVVRDLHWMLKKMWFLQGRMDDSDTCLMTTDQAYREYCALMRQRQEQMKAEAERTAEESQKAAAESEAERSRKQAMDPQILDIIQRGETFIEQIRTCNENIPGEEVSAKIFRMEILTRRIFDRVEEAPDTAGDIRRLMEYYLPTAIKLLEAYESLDAQPVQGENILSSKKEIEDTLDTLNGAFEVLLDDMFQDMAWDVSADASVLKTMLAQEGLTDKKMKTGGTQ